MFYQLKTRINRMKHNFVCRSIFNTPPLQIIPGSLTIFSMVSHSDLTMYLVAVKSFYHQVREGRIALLNDGSLTDADRQVLRMHLGDPQIFDMHNVQTGKCPKGGCWERLLTVIDLTQESYVIQIDSDTVTRGPVEEVVNSYRASRSFLLGSRRGQKLLPLSEAPKVVEDSTRHDHIQIIAERSFGKVKNGQNLRYVRASAGFGGFAKGVFSRKHAEDFSTMMQELMGEKWFDWGSEQVTSNYLLANAPDPVVLQRPKYTVFYPAVNVEETAFLHFIGTYRFTQGVYARESQRSIQMIQQQRNN